MIPVKDYWDKTARGIKKSGVQGGLRSLENSTKDLRRSIKAFKDSLVGIRKKPVKLVRDLSPRTDKLHDMTKSVSALYVAWTRLVAQCACFTLSMEEGTHLLLKQT